MNITSEIVELVESTPPPKVFPIAMQWNADGESSNLIVLFFNETSGICLHSKDDGYVIGKHQAWINVNDNTTWKPFHGTIQLTF